VTKTWEGRAGRGEGKTTKNVLKNAKRREGGKNLEERRERCKRERAYY